MRQGSSFDKRFQLHERQMEIFADPARFKVVAAGRQFGKTHLACVTALTEGMKTENELGHNITDKEVWYIAPTFQSGKDNMWNRIKTLGEGLYKDPLENTASFTFLNGRRFQIKGADRPDTLRGIGLSYAILDEFAFMKPEVWELIISPTLIVTQGGALFIGTPDGKNHFYELYEKGRKDESGLWQSFHYASIDNPFIPEEEIEVKRKGMSIQAFNQEFNASFMSAGSGAFKPGDIMFYDELPPGGYTYIAIDPAGFVDEANSNLSASELVKRDEFAIAVVYVCEEGWFVRDMIHGRWGVREASLKVIKAARDYGAVTIGIEKGSSKYALEPYLDDQMRRLGLFFNIQEVSHGGKKKTERIMWALQGRFQNHRIFLKKDAPWVHALVGQLMDFPNPRSHDDLPDALAYIDQVAVASYLEEVPDDDYEPLDEMSGY